jgi:uncharacterized protein GlcG (DUF336 family)
MNRDKELRALLAFIMSLACLSGAHAQGTFNVRILTPETALKAAQAALRKCRDSGFQATVAVVDRMGVTQVLLRDRFAGPHTPDLARAKARRRDRKAASATVRMSPRWAAA